MHAKYPELYTAEAAKYKPARVKRILRKFKISMPGQTSKYWPIIARSLAEDFDDDPLNFYRCGSIEAFVKLKEALRKRYGHERLAGFGPKIASLLAIFLEEYGLIKLDDALPVDLHVQRIFLSTKIVQAFGDVTNEDLETPIRVFLCDLCARRGWDRVKLAHALWFLGNKGCTDCSRRKDRQISCALYSECGGRAASAKYFGKGLWDPFMHPHRKGGETEFRLQHPALNSPQKPLFPPQAKLF
jgi:endonuclease III